MEPKLHPDIEIIVPKDNHSAAKVNILFQISKVRIFYK